MGLASAPPIDDILREGARRALHVAVEREVADYIERNKACVDEDGRRLVVRNGHHPARKILSGNGPKPNLTITPIINDVSSRVPSILPQLLAINSF